MVLLIDQFKEQLYEMYEVQLFNDITKDEDKVDELLKDLKLFN
jgi:hypothetical protein